MRATFDLTPRLAELLAYPPEDLPTRAAAFADSVMAIPEPWVDLVEAFALHARLTPHRELEEAYTTCFDMNPACCLDVGWHLFGEEYKRGQFMANLRPVLREHGVDEGPDLPDYLPTLLRLLPRLPMEEAEGLTRDCLLPALQKLRTKVDPKDPYALLLWALDLLLADLTPGWTGLEPLAAGGRHTGPR